MTGLADMEELLAAISNKEMVDYMREALTCYGAGAYRGCIVMSYLALFDDLKLKLAELAKINGPAKAIWLEVEKRSGNQEVFESFMADQLQAADLITKAEHKQLELIRDIRNRAAHPSGVHAKADAVLRVRALLMAGVDAPASRSVSVIIHPPTQLA